MGISSKDKKSKPAMQKNITLLRTCQFDTDNSFNHSENYTQTMIYDNSFIPPSTSPPLYTRKDRIKHAAHLVWVH